MKLKFACGKVKHIVGKVEVRNTKLLVFCTQTDTPTYTDGPMDGQTDRLIPVNPQKHLFCRDVIVKTILTLSRTINFIHTHPN